MTGFDLTQHQPGALEINANATNFADINGVRICYLDEGSGDQILFIHGGGACIETWNHQLSHFANHFRVLAPDCRGHGRSGDSDRPFSHALHASDMIGLLDFFDVFKAHVVGWSDGSCFALYMAMHYPERVASLIMLGGMYSIDNYSEAAMAGLRSMPPDQYYPYLVDLYERLSTRDWEEFFEKCRPMWLTEPNYRLPEMESIAAHTLIIMGEGDEWGGAMQARELEAPFRIVLLRLSPVQITLRT